MRPRVRGPGPRAVLAADLGGTRLRTAVVDAAGRLHAPSSRELSRPSTAESVYAELREALARLQAAPEGRGASAASLSMKGLVDARAGVSRHIADFEGWVDVPLKRKLGRSLGLPVFLENDCRCAALGEGWLGAARGRRDFVFVIVGTGIGTGLVRDGRLARGATGSAGEFGHTTLVDGDRRFRCPCGAYGHWEALAAGPSLAARARRELAAGRDDLVRLKRAWKGAADGAFVAAALAAGSPSARRVVEETGRSLGAGLYNVIRAVDPGFIVVGGGLAALGEALLRPAREECRGRLSPFGLTPPPIVKSRLGDRAGLLGAARLALG